MSISLEQSRWYAVYTKARWEKKVYKSLIDNGFEAYCPMNKVRKRWSDRFKWIEEPLFRSYVFVRVKEMQLTDVRMIKGVVNFVYWLGKPAIIKPKEIQIIRRFLNEYEEVEVMPLALNTDVKVTIRKGPFMDKEGQVIRVLNKRVQVMIESIGYRLVAIIDRSNLALAGKK